MECGLIVFTAMFHCARKGCMILRNHMISDLRTADSDSLVHGSDELCRHLESRESLKEIIFEILFVLCVE